MNRYWGVARTVLVTLPITQFVFQHVLNIRILWAVGILQVSQHFNSIGCYKLYHFLSEYLSFICYINECLKTHSVKNSVAVIQLFADCKQLNHLIILNLILLLNSNPCHFVTVWENNNPMLLPFSANQFVNVSLCSEHRWRSVQARCVWMCERRYKVDVDCRVQERVKLLRHM